MWGGYIPTEALVNSVILPSSLPSTDWASKNSVDKENAIQESKILVKEIEKIKDNEEMYKEILSKITPLKNRYVRHK